MPTVAKSSSNISKLGDLSTFDVSSSAVPYDTNDSAGSVPTFRAMFVDGTEPEYLLGETLTLTNPSVGTYSGEIVSYSSSANSNRYSLDSNSIMARLNSELRAYPLSDYAGTDSVWIPMFALEYWTQQCGVFYSAVEGEPLFYQSQYGHFGAFAKGITRPIRSTRPSGPDPAKPMSQDGRMVVTFGRNSEWTVNMPQPKVGAAASEYLPVLIPSGPTRKVVFGGDVYLDGIGRRGWITFYFKSATGVQLALRLQADTNSGFTLFTSDVADTYASRITIPAFNERKYTFLIGVSSNPLGYSYFTLTIVDADNNIVGTTTITTATFIRGALTLTKVKYRGEDVGSGRDMTYSNIFISQNETMPTHGGVTQKALQYGYKAADFLIGFNGNVWEHVKQYCSIYHLDVSYKDGKLTIGPRRRDVASGVSLSDLGTKIQAREQARFVEVVNQQHKPTGPSPKVMWKADSVYQVAVGEVQEFLVQTKHSILEVSQPVAVSGINPFPYTAGAGQYVVTGSDGYIVSPTFWRDQGGSITADTTENEGEIKIVIKGPDFDSPRAPYRISEGDAGRPALYVTGQGVLADPKTVKIGTGNRTAAKDVGATLDCAFIGNAKLTFDAGVRMARSFAVPEVSVTIAEPLGYDEVSKLGATPAGALAKRDGNIYRVTDVNQGYSNVSGTAVQHNTIYQLKRNQAGATIGDVNDYYDGKTIQQTNLKPIKKVN